MCSFAIETRENNCPKRNSEADTARSDSACGGCARQTGNYRGPQFPVCWSCRDQILEKNGRPSAVKRGPNIDLGAPHRARANCNLPPHQPHSLFHAPNADATLSESSRWIEA